MHPWHDVPIDSDRIADAFPVIVEVPMGSRNKYEVDKTTGLLRLDRVLYGALYYPASYGFVPQTYAHDGDALDVLVFGQEPVHPLTIVDVRVIGMIHMQDQRMSDDKLLAVNIGDPAVSDYREITDLPGHLLRQMVRFFEDYKGLEGKHVEVREPRGRDSALDVLRVALAAYRQHFAGSRPR